jgi:dipeptidase E
VTFVLIGGGEIGRPGTKIETLSIDKEVVRLSGKRSPNLLFIPTASGDSTEYVKVVERYYGKKLGCQVSPLFLYGKQVSKHEIKKKIRAADIVYVGGGNTLRMLRVWKKYGLGELLEKAERRGTVLAGISAGAICWCKFGNSDSRKVVDPSADYIRVRGLGFLPFFLVPHFDKEKERQASLKSMLEGTRQVAVGLDNCSALVIKNGMYKLLTSNKEARGHVCHWKKGKYVDTAFFTQAYRPISDLLGT